MTNQQPTVMIRKDEDHPIIWMEWAHRVDKRDVEVAFKHLKTLLDGSDKQKLWIIVDLLQKPRFPMLETIKGASLGVYAHKNLAQWPVVGGDSVARSIERILSHATAQQRVTWFDTIAQAETHVQAHSLADAD